MNSLANSLEGALKNIVLTEQKSASRNSNENASKSNKKNNNENIPEPPKSDASKNPELEKALENFGISIVVPQTIAPPVAKDPPKKFDGDIANLLEVDANFINFGTFYPGKIFKCNLNVKNLTNHKRSVVVYFDNTLEEFSRDSLLRTLFMGPLPAGLTYPIANSEFEQHCWHFMMPPSKAFEKTMTLTIAAHNSVQVGVVIKSPCINYAQKFFSLVRTSLSQEDPMQTLLDQGKDSLITLCQAEVITPKLECCKELIHEQTKLKIIPLVVKFEGAIQRLRVPFKNAGSKDIEILLSIMKYPTSPDRPEPEPIAEYHCVPGNVKLPANSMGFVTIGISQCTSNLKEDARKSKEQREQRVLICKIKDTLMMYSYILDCSFIQ